MDKIFGFAGWFRYGPSKDIHEAAEKGDLSFLKRHLDDPSTNLKLVDYNKNTVLHLAVRGGRFKVVEWLLDHKEFKTHLEDKTEDGGTALHFAAIVGNVEIIEKLLDAGAVIEAKSNRQMTPLHLAAYAGAPKAVETLMKRGADPCAKNVYNATPLHLAVERDILVSKDENGHDKVVELLLADERVQRFVKTPRGQLTTTGFSPLVYACYGGHLECARWLIEKGTPLDPNAKGYVMGKNLPLQAAALSGHDKIVELLLEKQPCIVNIKMRGEKKRSALYIAAQYGHSDIFSLILSALENSDLQLDLATQLEGGLIAAAVKSGSIEIFNMILSELESLGLDPATQLEGGLIAAAVRSGSADIVNLILQKEKSLELNLAADLDGDLIKVAVQRGYDDILDVILEKRRYLGVATELDGSFIDLATAKGHSGVVKVLLDYGAEVSTDDPSSHPLTIAAKQGHKDVFFYLLEKYPYPTFDSGRTILHFAAQGGCLEIVQRILEDKPDMLNLKIEYPSGSEGHPVYALDFAASTSKRKFNIEIVRLLMKEKAKFNTSLNAGFYFLALDGQEGNVKEVLGEASAEVKDNLDQFKFQLLCGAAAGGHTNLVKLLLNEYKAPISSALSKESALNSAAEGGEKAIVKLLLERGADISYSSQDGNNALHIAVNNGFEAVIELLLEKVGKGSINEKNKIEETPLYIALKRRYFIDPGIVKLLLREGADVGCKCVDENTALHRAVLSENEESISLLLEKDADINALNVSKNTPLHLAVSTKQRRNGVTTALLTTKSKYEPDFSLENKDGKTPLMLAKENNKKAPSELIATYISKGFEVVLQSVEPVIKDAEASTLTTEVGESSGGQGQKRQVLDSETSNSRKKQKMDLEEDTSVDMLCAISTDTDFTDEEISMASMDLENRLKRLQSKPNNAGKMEIAMLSNDDQLGCYLGLMHDLLDYMENTKGKNTVSTKTVMTWIQKNPQWWKDKKLDKWLKRIGADINTPGAFHIDHIIPNSLGGVDHPRNYFLLCGSINSSFNKWFTNEKVCYIGKKVCRSAQNFMKWSKKEAAQSVNYHKYNPIDGYF